MASRVNLLKAFYILLFNGNLGYKVFLKKLELIGKRK